MNVGQSNRWKETLDRWFCATAVLVLALTAVTKGIGAAGEARILAQPDPLLGMLTNRQVLLLAAVLELLVIGLVVGERHRVRKAAILAWISSVFLAYRVGLQQIGYHGSCGCLGNITDTLGIAPATADLVSGGMLAYLLIGSYSILLWEAVSNVRAGRWRAWLANPG
jgi:hypothetical protein